MGCRSFAVVLERTPVLRLVSELLHAIDNFACLAVVVVFLVDNFTCLAEHLVRLAVVVVVFDDAVHEQLLAFGFASRSFLGGAILFSVVH